MNMPNGKGLNPAHVKCDMEHVLCHNFILCGNAYALEYAKKLYVFG